MKKSIIPVQFGILIASGLTVYFLILSLIGVHTNPIFSLGNGIIVGRITNIKKVLWQVYLRALMLL